jgi:uncharacterized glyoxalase superfamily protein PhnB
MPAGTPTSPIPAQHRRLIPHLAVDRGVEALALYAKAFGARELVRLVQPDTDRLLYGELCIGDALFCVHDALEGERERSPRNLGGVSGGLWLYVEDVDAALAQAVAAGCELLEPAADLFWGDRAGTLCDPFGHVWTLASRIKELSPNEIAAAAQAAFGQA